MACSTAHIQMGKQVVVERKPWTDTDLVFDTCLGGWEYPGGTWRVRGLPLSLCV